MYEREPWLKMPRKALVLEEPWLEIFGRTLFEDFKEEPRE